MMKVQNFPYEYPEGIKVATLIAALERLARLKKPDQNLKATTRSSRAALPSWNWFTSNFRTIYQGSGILEIVSGWLAKIW